MNIRFLPPTTNVDGTPIDYTLAYEAALYVPVAGTVDEATVGSLPEPSLVDLSSSELRVDVSDYLDSLGLPPGTYYLVIRAVNPDPDSPSTSAWTTSEPVSLVVVDPTPNPPTDVVGEF